MDDKDSETGYEIACFKDQKACEDFTCMICFCVVKNPRQCSQCHNIFCYPCITRWFQIKNQCPIRCNISIGWGANRICYISHERQEEHNNLEIQCSNKDCKQKWVKLCNLKSHQNYCGMKQKEQINNKSKLKTQQDCKVQGVFNFQWDQYDLGDNITISKKEKSVNLKEDNKFIFRTVIANKALFEGRAYWEIMIHEETKKEMKIGVSCQKKFDKNKSFSDFDFGFAYYGQGSLRHNSSKSGQKYGEKFKNGGKIGVFLDMYEGTLSFALNGVFMGVAFKSTKLRQGPIYPAVSLLNCGKFFLQSGMKFPSYMQISPKYKLFQEVQIPVEFQNSNKSQIESQIEKYSKLSYHKNMQTVLRTIKIQTV